MCIRDSFKSHVLFDTIIHKPNYTLNPSANPLPPTTPHTSHQTVKKSVTTVHDILYLNLAEERVHHTKTFEANKKRKCSQVKVLFITNIKCMNE